MAIAPTNTLGARSAGVQLLSSRLLLRLARICLAALLASIAFDEPSAGGSSPPNTNAPSDVEQGQDIGGLLSALSRLELLNDDAVAARNDAETSLKETRQALETQKTKMAQLERDLAEARRTIETLTADAKLTAARQVQARAVNPLVVQDLEIAPSWIEISTFEAMSPVNPRACPTRIRWPVEETGRNSVNPSIIPRMTASSGPQFIILK